ncbi:MAG: BrnT family toxin [Caldilineaceae bacterium SB0665_bin_25]|nr:BrnT family toxin [Caldilineaceae bacterium SB0665_bin_25]
MTEYRFTWDRAKSLTNRRKHGISFELAARVFFDPLHVSVQDRIEDGEVRWQTMGQVGGTMIVVVAHTVVEDEDAEVIRIVSARPATRKERNRYEEG